MMRRFWRRCMPRLCIRWARGRWFAPLAYAVVALALTTPVSAARVVRTEPRPGQVLTDAPSAVTVYVDGPLAASPLNALMVQGPDLRQIDRGDLQIGVGSAPYLRVSLPSNLGPGRYVVSYVAVAVNGRSDRGQFAFYMLTPPTARDRAADRALSIDNGTQRTSAGGADVRLVLALTAGAVAVVLVAGGLALALRRRS